MAFFFFHFLVILTEISISDNIWARPDNIWARPDNIFSRPDNILFRAKGGSTTLFLTQTIFGLAPTIFYVTCLRNIVGVSPYIDGARQDIVWAKIILSETVFLFSLFFNNVWWNIVYAKKILSAKYSSLMLIIYLRAKNTLSGRKKNCRKINFFKFLLERKIYYRGEKKIVGK